jgi:hypothetical protein
VRISIAWLVASAAVSLCGCTALNDTPDPSAIVGLDETTFRCTVEPILIRDCSYTACHGNAGFALRVYSVGKLRASTPATLDDQVAPLTTDERHANYQSAVAFTYGNVTPAENWLIRKPLPASAGGFEHVGGAIFDGVDDPRVVAITDWLNGKIHPCKARQ